MFEKEREKFRKAWLGGLIEKGKEIKEKEKVSKSIPPVPKPAGETMSPKKQEQVSQPQVQFSMNLTMQPRFGSRFKK